MKLGDSYMKVLLVIFREKFHLGLFDLFRPFFTVCLDMVEIESGHSYYWIFIQNMISFMITTGSLNSMIRIHKQSRHDLSGKYLFDGYCMDI